MKRARLPERGADREAVLETMAAFRKGDANWHDGRTWSLVYHAGDEHKRFLERAHNLYFSENGLNPMAFRSLRRMESEVVQMTAAMLNGPADSVGTMTSGGTESILLAVKTYRDRARRLRPWVLRPEIVAPRSIHVAFEKAAHYFGVKLRHAPLRDDFRVDLDAMRRMIGHNTIAIAASAPQYPQGVIDPIAELGALAQEKKLPFHVDSCIGGFVLPWLEKLGHPLPPWDFRVPGVTSISADVHKYGFAAKGASVIAYRSMDYLRDQFFISVDWPGGVYPSPTIAGTRPGGSIAAAWAAMMAMGESGYVEQTREAFAAARRLQEGISAIPGLEVLGPPDATLVACGATDEAVDLYAVADLMETRGWHLDRQQKPASLHCTVTANNGPVVDEYLRDLRDCVAHVRAHPELRVEGNAAMYGLMARVPVRGMVKQSVRKVMESLYGPDGEVPDLAELGGGEKDDLVMKLMNRHGARIFGALDRLETLRRRFRRG